VRILNRIVLTVGLALTVASQAVAELTFAPEPNYAVHVGATLTFSVGPAGLGITASGLPAGATFDGTTFSWTPSQQAARESDEGGAFREGRYTVTFTTTAGIAVDVKIGVSEEELVSLFVPDQTIGIGAESVAVIGVTFSDESTALGSVSNPITPTWQTADPAIAFVSNVLPDGTIVFVQSVDRGATVLGVTSIAIDPPLLDLPLGASDVLQATATLEDGSPSTAVPFAWSSSEPTTVSVPAGGIVRGNTFGSATITAIADNVSASADVTVVPPLRALSFFGLDVLPPSVDDSGFVVLDTLGGAPAHAALLGPYFMEEPDSNGLNELVVSGLEATTFQTAFQTVDATGAVTLAHVITDANDFVTDLRLQDDGTIYAAADDGRYGFSRISTAGQATHIGAPSGSTGFGEGTLALAGADVVYTGPWDYEYSQGPTVIGTASLVGLYDAAQSGQQQHVPVAVATWGTAADSMVAPGGVLHAIDGPSGVVYRFVDLDGDGDHFFLQDSVDEFGNPVREALDDPGEREVFANLPLALAGTLRADLTTGALFAARVTGVDPKRVRVLKLVDLNGDGDADDAGEQVVVFDAAAPAGTSIGGVDLKTECIDGADTDGDGVVDPCDNCLLVPNGPGESGTAPSQIDSDVDGYGNLCDCDFATSANGACGGDDFLVLGAGFGFSVGAPDCPADVDLNGNGACDGPDFPIFGGLFGKPVGPSGLSCAGTPPCVAN
jgi:hypothetical protein